MSAERISCNTSRQLRIKRVVAVARVSEPRSLVEVLNTQAAVAGAARRAASFERDAAARANGRAERYEALGHPR